LFIQLFKNNTIFDYANFNFFKKIILESQTLLYKSSRISYYRFGDGERPVICFHGYGETAESFSFLAKYAGSQFSFYAIDLPFHGKTDWKEGLNFHKADLTAISLAVTGHTRLLLTLMGFSLGGRMALSLFEDIPQKIDKLILLAPDGLKVNFWYWLSTQTWLGNRFFAFTMKYPGWFFGLLQLMNKLKLVNASIFKFVKHYIGDMNVRQLLYQRWTTLRKIKPHLSIAKTKIKQNKTAVRLLYGIHDRIILSSVGEKFRSEIEDHCDIKIIHSGHQVLHEKHIKEILPSLLH
jgi:pimeloyl-ACP methyl ester carboxylesterase